MKLPDYYEILQISPNADTDTIHRVFQLLAARLHPDNPQTGDRDKFITVNEAHSILSVQERRAKYDETLKKEVSQPVPLCTSIDFMDDIEEDSNRRLALLALLYKQRRTCSDRPFLSLFDVEKLMGFSRDFLDFTIWYALKKGYITRADNSAFTLTAEGVDFVESQRDRTPALRKMLTAGSDSKAVDQRSNARVSENHATPYVVQGERRGGVDRRRRG